MSKLLSTGNSKLQKSGTDRGLFFASFGLPAATTCPGALHCKQGCYALSGTYLFKAVKESRERNLEATKRADFIEVISKEIEALDAKLTDKVLCIRIHDSGDFYNLQYLYKWVEVSERFPHVLFYCYTKSPHLFIDGNIEGLDNFRVIFSEGGKFDRMFRGRNYPHARVFESEQELLAAGYTNASNDDAVAIFGGSKIGLVYHGQKQYNKTDWSKIA